MIDLNLATVAEQPAREPALDPCESLLARIRRKHATVGLIGLGYVGLPLARAFTQGGFSVLGFDIDPTKVGQLRRGASYIGHIPSQMLGDMLKRGFAATTDF